MRKLLPEYLTKFVFYSFVLLFAFASQAKRPELHLLVKDHLFYPATVTIPANTKIKLVITNRDNTIEEFDSFSLNREKVLFPHQTAIIFIGPLPSGEYKFFGEYHPHSAKGKIVVVQSLADKHVLKEGAYVN